MSRKTLFIFAGIVLLLLSIFFINNSQKDKWRWELTYKEDDKNPYGMYVLHELLKNFGMQMTDLKDYVSKSLPQDVRGANYVFVGEALYLDSLDTQRLMKFASNGNRVFISSEVVPFILFNAIYDNTCQSFMYNKYNYSDQRDRLITLNFTHPKLREEKPFEYPFVMQYDTMHKYWYTIDTTTACTRLDGQISVLGLVNDFKANFIKIRVGEGEIYLHSTPLAFTNYHLVNDTSLRYAQKVFSHLNPSGAIYWDVRGRVARKVGESMNRRNRGERGGNQNPRLEEDSPLKYVLSEPALRWAWYLFLGLIVTYMIFHAKRKQRIIPILAKKKNASLEFVRTVGQMYFIQNDSSGLCELKIKQFRTFVKERYHLSAREMNEEFIQTLAQKAAIPSERIQRIVSYEKRIKNLDITESALISLHELLDNFYKKCK